VFKKSNTFTENEPEQQSDGKAKLRILKDSDDSLSKEFDLKSEYFEKGIQVSPELRKEDHNIVTKVKVHHKDHVEEIDADQIKEVIKNNKGIKQIVVEKISLEEATRYSLLFAPKGDTLTSPSLLKEREEVYIDYNEKRKMQKRWSIKELEHFANSSFLNMSQGTKDEGHDDVSVVENEQHVDAAVSVQPLKLKLKSEESTFIDKPTLGKIDKNLKYEKHTLTKKKNRSYKAYYYRAKDHMELYKVGSSYLKDFRSGLKAFSFSSIGIDKDREKTVFGICSFFNYHEDLNICILTASLKNSFYEYICKDYEDKEMSVFDEDLSLSIKRGRGFDLIQYKDLKKIERKIQHYDFETFIDYLSDRYDLLLWDLPSFDILDTNKELYFPIIRALDNVSLIIKKDISKINEISEVISYFRRYQVDIKGLLYSSGCGESTTSRQEEVKS
jgi:hypothetical protein